MTPKEERRLVKRLKARDERAFREFVFAHEKLVFNLVFRMLGNYEEAEDVSQEVFVTVFKAIGSFRGKSRLSTWLYRIAANHAKNRLKYLARRRTDRRQSLDTTSESEIHRARPQSSDAPESIAIGLELERLVQDALSRLEDDHRLVIVLRDLEHLSYDEISAITGLTMGTVKSRLHRARAALKQTLTRLERRGKRP